MFFPDNRNELENIIVDAHGMINDVSNKIFSMGLVRFMSLFNVSFITFLYFAHFAALSSVQSND